MGKRRTFIISPQSYVTGFSKYFIPNNLANILNLFGEGWVFFLLFLLSSFYFLLSSFFFLLSTFYFLPSSFFFPQPSSNHYSVNKKSSDHKKNASALSRYTPKIWATIGRIERSLVVIGCYRCYYRIKRGRPERHRIGIKNSPFTPPSPLPL